MTTWQLVKIASSLQFVDYLRSNGFFQYVPICRHRSSVFKQVLTETVHFFGRAFKTTSGKAHPAGRRYRGDGYCPPAYRYSLQNRRSNWKSVSEVRRYLARQFMIRRRMRSENRRQKMRIVRPLMAPHRSRLVLACRQACRTLHISPRPSIRSTQSFGSADNHAALIAQPATRSRAVDAKRDRMLHRANSSIRLHHS